MQVTELYSPIFEVTRGQIVESVHYGAVAVVDIDGNLIAYYGDPNAVTYLRSTAKPIQVLPFFERGGGEVFNLEPCEVAVMCSSHSGTDDHISVILSAQRKTGVRESDLMCGVHYPLDKETTQKMQASDSQPSPNQHNCSGMHTALVANARMLGLFPPSSANNLAYIDADHPVQQEIIRAIAQMCDVEKSQIALGIDGCSVPTFGVPLRNVALAYARLCDPENGGVFPEARSIACQKISSAMKSNPFMVAGPSRFDTCLMQTGGGRILSKGGAEGYLGMAIMSDNIQPGIPTIGIAIKISDGSGREEVRPAVALEVLRQLDLLSEKELDSLSDFGPRYPIFNCRDIKVGEGQPAFTLKKVKN